MITADMAKANARQAMEDSIEKMIYSASKVGEDSTTVSKEALPGWLNSKLQELGYIVQATNTKPNGIPMYKIFWGC